MASESRYIVARKDFPALPHYSLPLIPRSCGVDIVAGHAISVTPRPLDGFIQINWIRAGSGALTLSDHELDVGRGDVIIQYPREPRGIYRSQHGLDIRWLTFEGEQAVEFMRSYGYEQVIHAGVNNLEVFFAQFEKNLKELTASGMRKAIANITMLLAEIGACRPAEEDPMLVQRFRQAAERFYQDPTCDVNMLCAHLRVHRGTLSRIFHDSGNESPGQCLREIRVRHALELLGLGTSVAETAQKCGFLTPTYFSQAIRRVTGQSPKHFQLWK